MNDDTVLNTLLFADHQVLLSDSDDDFQTALCTLHNSKEQFGMEISSLKSKAMTFKSQVLIRSKTVIDNIILEQIHTFTYLGRQILY
jgi:hypothetical protein